MMLLRDGFNAHADDFAWCEDVIKRNSQSFYRAFSLLPERKRAGVYAVYAFCREADDLVDEHASAEALAALQDQLERFAAGDVPDEPLWRALGVVFDSFAMDATPFYDMLEGQRRDLAFQQPHTMSELEEYGYYVAGTVGLMLLPLLHTESSVPAHTAKEAVELGIAMQLTNILRDVGEDWEVGRVYLPEALFDETGYRLEDLAAHKANPAFRTLWETVAGRAEELYLPLQNDIYAMDEDSRLTTLSSLFLYRGILDQVRADDYACLDRRSRVSADRARELVGEAQACLREGRR